MERSTYLQYYLPVSKQPVTQATASGNKASVNFIPDCPLQKISGAVVRLEHNAAIEIGVETVFETVPQVEGCLSLVRLIKVYTHLGEQ
jgi:hypothetical protein